MPTRTFRRTPASEEAAGYGYGDLLQDALALAGEKATTNVERMISGGLSDEEVTEMALAPAGGMLKTVGTSKLLAGLLARQKRVLIGKRAAETGRHPTYSPLKGQTEREVASYFAPTQRVFREALKVPEKEYGRIKDISWGSMAGQPLGTRGLYDPSTKKITLHSGLRDLETIWHEFTHARQFKPERGSKLPGGGSEEAASYTLRELLNSLAEVAEEAGMSGKQFYEVISPIERHARGVSRAAVKFPRDFSTLYKYGLRSEVATSRRNLEKFRRNK